MKEKETEWTKRRARVRGVDERVKEQRTHFFGELSRREISAFLIALLSWGLKFSLYIGDDGFFVAREDLLREDSRGRYLESFDFSEFQCPGRHTKRVSEPSFV